jgi:hypothetical protein
MNAYAYGFAKCSKAFGKGFISLINGINPQGAPSSEVEKRYGKQT